MTLAAHGTQKLFGWFGGHGLEGTGRGFETIGFLPGRRHALMAGLTEVGGGALLALGFLTPLAATTVFAVMFVAAVSVHVKQGFFITTGGFEYNLILGVAGLSAAFTGPGSVSIDALLGWQPAGASWGAAAFVVGVLGGATQLASRRPSPAIPVAQ
jgi:putative oxidoreductase